MHSLQSRLSIIISAIVLCANAVSLPTCQSTAPPEKILSDVRTARLNVSGSPFGVVYASTPNRAFAAIGQTLGVLNTSGLTPSLLYSINLTEAILGATGALGIAQSHDGCHVFVAGGTGAVIVDTAKALQGDAGAVVGSLTGSSVAGESAIRVTLSRDDRFAFINQEYGSNVTGNRGDIEVFKLRRSASNASVTGTYVGYLALGNAVAGSSLSPDGRILYATSERANNSTTQGTLSIIDVKKLKTSPQSALVNTVDAGCSPVRVIPSRDGKIVWVTARESNRLLAFDATKLRKKGANALLASIQVGTSPVGLIFAKNETRILTADSNRFNNANTTTGVSVIDVHAALRGEAALFGQIPTGAFPREFAISKDGKTILVSDFGSQQVQAIDTTSLP